MSTKILVIGKISFNLDFSILDEISNESGSVSKASDVKRYFTGLGANIAYGVSVMGSSPVLISIVGKDFDVEYRDYLEKRAIELMLYYQNDKETATNYMIHTSDERILKIQQENAYRFIAEQNLEDKFSDEELKAFEAVLIGTGKVEADAKFISMIHSICGNTPLVYTLDGNIKEFVNWKLNQILENTIVLICRSDELLQIEQILKQTTKEILNRFPRLKYIISVYDRDKIVINSLDMTVKVSAGPAEEILSEEYWYDAFRAGILFGISLKKPIIEAVKIGSALASYAVEKRENQQYSPSPEQVLLRSYEVSSTFKS